MAWRDVPLADTVTVQDTGIADGGGGVIVGSPPVWKDDSDATYASFGGHYLGDGNPQFYGEAAAGVAASVASLPLVLDVRAHVRIRAEAGTSPRMPRFRLQQQVGGGHEITVAPMDVAPVAATWIPVPLSLTEEQAADFAVNPSIWRLTILPPEYFAPGVPNELQRWRVFEARLEAKVRSDAPPCRLFPRADGLGVGGGRNFPPPKSRQRSSRRFGYY